MIEDPPFEPPYRTIVKTATGAIVTETLADGSTQELGEVAFETLQVTEIAVSVSKRSAKQAVSITASDKVATYLNVSFADKEKAKSKGAKWDADKKKWYAPHGTDINVFKPWWPDTLK
jgi:hypothetical protein